VYGGLSLLRKRRGVCALESNSRIVEKDITVGIVCFERVDEVADAVGAADVQQALLERGSLSYFFGQLLDCCSSEGCVSTRQDGACVGRSGETSSYL
jgi:hypothetical protein